MEMKILSNNENKLLNRKEIKFWVLQDSSTVRKEDIKKEICKKLNLSPENTIVVRIDQGFGTKESSGIAHSYETKELLEKYESKRLQARIAKKAAKSEKKEEPKQEEKTE
ncbi:MAG: hypothetical protein ABR981_05405 [Candidatus Micrarchaeaceae archaeon]|jgi:small subunit ribosomal protein S24e